MNGSTPVAHAFAWADEAAAAAATEELPCPAKVVPLVLDGVPSLPSAVIYAAGIMEPPLRWAC